MRDQLPLSLAYLTTQACDKTSTVLNLDCSLLDFVLAQPNISVRLANVVRSAAHDGILPFSTIAEYLHAGPNAIDQMMKLPNLGKKSLAELNALIDAYIRTPLPLDSLKVLERFDVSIHDFDITLAEFLRRQPRVSTRLLNSVKTADNEGLCPFLSVAEYIQSKNGFSKLCNLPNLGRTSANEFKELVQAAIVRGSTWPLPSKQDVRDDNFSLDIATLMDTVFESLKGRELDILRLRLGSAQTLEQVASNFGLTRERVRQIESRVFRQLRRAFTHSFQNYIFRLCRHFELAGMPEFTLAELASIASSKVDTVELFLQITNRLEIPGADYLAVSDTHIYRKDQFSSPQEWRSIVKKALIDATWPLELIDFLTITHSVPRFFTERFLVEQYGAKICNNKFSVLPSLSTAEMCTQVLLRTGKPTHTSELRALIAKYFDKDIPESLVNATVGRLKTVTIAAPGTYVHYASLTYSKEVLSNIRTLVHLHLSMQDCFIGSKVLFEHLFLKQPNICPKDFNHYLMMGIVQDDDRFVTKRGNMIGLASFDLKKSFVSLEDEVRNSVLDDGPISITEILERLSPTRKLCNDSGIRLILANSPSIIQVGSRTYDSLHRFFASRDEYENMLIAIQINLLFRPKSLYTLVRELNALGFSQATASVVESLINAISNINELDGAYECDPIREELSLYRSASSSFDFSHVSRESVLEKLQSHISKDIVEKWIQFDYRFTNLSFRQNYSNDTSELNSILNEFNF